MAAANRAKYVIENYPKTPSIPEALKLLAKAYQFLEMDDLANDATRVYDLNFAETHAETQQESNE